MIILIRDPLSFTDWDFNSMLLIPQIPSPPLSSFHVITSSLNPRIIAGMSCCMSCARTWAAATQAMAACSRRRTLRGRQACSFPRSSCPLQATRSRLTSQPWVPLSCPCQSRSSSSSTSSHARSALPPLFPLPCKQGSQAKACPALSTLLPGVIDAAIAEHFALHPHDCLPLQNYLVFAGAEDQDEGIHPRLQAGL